MYDEDNDADQRDRLLEVFRNEDGEVSRYKFMTYRYPLDPATGLPETEDGGYFRVKVTDDKVTVKYMSKRWWWFDRTVQAQRLETLGQKLTADNILWLALLTLERRDQKLWLKAQLSETAARLKQKQRDSREHNARFNGNYPPKVLVNDAKR